MQALVQFTIDQVALEGPEGCSITRLLQIFQDEKLDGYPTQFQHGIPATVIDWLFELLPQRSTDIEIFRSRLNSDEKAKLTELPKLDSLSEEDKQNIVLLASQGMRDAALGLYDEHLSNYKISPIQRLTLEVIGSRRTQGALRTELAKRMNSDAGKFHYILKLLEARRLVVMSPVIAKEETTRIGHGIQTAIVHLRKFAPKLAEGQIFIESATEPGKFTVSDDQSRQMRRVCEQLKDAVDQTLIEADLKQILGFRLTQGHRGWRRIRAHLEKLGHIKAFKATFADHKSTKPKTAIKLIKPVSSGKSFAKFKEEDDEEDEDMDVNPIDLVAEKGFDWQVMAILADSGREGAFKHKICKKLGVSMKKMKKRMDDISVRFGIIETNEQNGKQIVKKWRAPESVLRHKQEELEGPQPENGFQNLLQSVLGATNISQTIQDAVQEKEAQKAAEISQKGQKGKSLELEFPALNETPGTKDGNASDLKVPSKAISQPLQPFALTLDDIPETQQAPVEKTQAEDMEVEYESDHLSGPAKEAMNSMLQLKNLKGLMPRQKPLSEELAVEPAYQGPQEPALLENLPEGQALPDLPQDLLDDVNAVTVTNVGLTNAQSLTAKATSLAQDRLDRLCRKIVKDRYMLKVDIANFFLTSEDTHGKMLLDKRTVMRIVDRGVATGRLKHYCIHNPGKAVNMPDSINVILAPEIRLEDNKSLIREIRKANRKRSLTRYSSARHGSEQVEDVQHVEKITRLKPLPKGSRKTEEGEEEEGASEGVIAAMWENGLIHARMIKARLLHTFLCKLVGLAGCESGLRNVFDAETCHNTRDEDLTRLFNSDQSTEATLQYSLLSGTVPEKRETEAKVTLQQAAETNKGLFTFQALWPLLPLDLFCQIIGCSNRHPAVQELILKGTQIGDLTPQENQAIIDVHAKRRLSNILDMLNRMGLIRGAVYSLNTHFTRTERSIFIVRPDVAFQEPSKVTDKKAAAGSYEDVKFDLRADEELDNYWNRLEYVSIEEPEEMRRLFPGRMMKEMFSKKAWTRDKMMSMEQWVGLQRMMNEKLEEFGWKQCQKAAEELGLDVEQVNKLALTFRGRVNRKREKLSLGDKLPKLPISNRRTGQSKYENDDVKRATYQKQYKKTQKGWLHGIRFATRNQGPSVLRPWEVLEEDPEKAKNAAKSVEEDEGDVQEPPPTNTRRFGWIMEDDRFVLHGYVKWHAISGFQECAFRSQHRPVEGVTFVERQGYKRVREFERDAKVKALMAKIHDIVENVYKRADNRGDSMKALLRKTDKEARAAINERRANTREQRKKEANDKLGKAVGIKEGKEVEEEENDDAREIENVGKKLVRFPELEAGALFKTVDEEDISDHAQIFEIIEDILSMAPRRVDNLPDLLPSGSKKRKRGDGDTKVSMRAHNPTAVGTSKTRTQTSLQANLQRHVKRSALSRTKLLSQQRNPVTPPIANAMELALALMSLTDEERLEIPDSATALSRRFTDEQISEAFSQLRLQNFVLHDFRLSADFKALSQMVDLPETLFKEASNSLKNFEASETGIVTVEELADEIPGGFVAGVLELFSLDMATFALPPPENFKSNLMAPIRQAGHTSMSDVNWTISADCSQGNPELPEGLLMSSLTNEEEIEDWDNVKRVMGNDQYREKALSSCKNDADRTSSPCSVEAVDSVYREIQFCKAEGCSEKHLRDTTGVENSECHAALQMLRSGGLVTCVPGFSDWIFVGSEHSAIYFTDPEPEKATSKRSDKPDTRLELKGSTIRGRKLLAPWLDHKGNLIEATWTRVTQRLISILLNNPGITEEEIIADMVTLTPMSVRRLLNILGDKHMILKQESISSDPDLPTIFGGRPTQKVQTSYYVDPRHCFFSTQSLSF